MIKNKTIKVNTTEIKTFTINNLDYISITDIAKQ